MQAQAVPPDRKGLDRETIARILKIENYFDILGVPQQQQLDLSLVRREYKKLALLVHPDKSSHVDAERAFKKLAQAYEVLSDVDLQAQYFLHQCTSSSSSSSSFRKRKKYKKPAQPKTDGVQFPNVKRRKRTAREIWEAFEVEEREFRQQQKKPKSKFSRDDIQTKARTTSGVPEAQIDQVLDSDLGAKAQEWSKFHHYTTRHARSSSSSTRRSLEVTEQEENTRLCCLLCRRRFQTLDQLLLHREKSTLHRTNLNTAK